MILTHINKLVLVIVLVVSLYACQQPGGNSPGSEYMPDMAHSIAYEANYNSYYYYNTWGTEDEYYKYASPRKPVPGTVARASKSGDSNSTPYPYPNTEEGRTAAMNGIINNPYPITDAGMANAKELYNIFCGICHGEKGDGAGYLVRDDGGVYPVQPANFLLDEFVTASNGRYYHSIVHGRNLMGSYKDKLSYEERWQVIHYIRSLQAKEKKLAYNQYENTLNGIEVPAGDSGMLSMSDDSSEGGHHSDHGEMHDGEHNGDDTHHKMEGHDHEEGHDGHEENHEHHDDEHKNGHDEEEDHDEDHKDH